MKKSIIFFILCFATIQAKEAEYRDTVYLATYPRSGNTWTRLLIEEATHIKTESVYPNETLPEQSLYAKDIIRAASLYQEASNIVVMKTHYPCFNIPLNPRSFPKAIHIIRNPIDSFYSFAVFENKGSRIGFVPNNVLVRMIKEWKQFQTFWLSQNNVFTIRYEDILQNPGECLAKILDEIGYQVDEEDILRAINMFPPLENELKHLKHFSKSDIQFIKNQLGPIMKKFHYEIPDS
ncbi:MAG: sulfotransferase domain-containing protein [Chlamydiae bacterium]|nr:sulfotransferase domain-containing protein [Chlamydiota bacterium]